MHLVVDAVAVGPGSSAIVVEHLLDSWHATWPHDRLTVVCGPGGPAFAVPPGVHVERLRSALPGPLRGLAMRTFGVRRAAHRLGADAVLSGVPASGILGTRCTRGLILYDLRHELRPEQFSRVQRLARMVSWGASMRRVDAIFTISQRTLDDLRRRHPRAGRLGVAAVLGSDHAATWRPATSSERPYAVAFGHFANKNATAVIRGWARFGPRHPDWQLRLVGMGTADRAAAAALVEQLGISDRVELTPWLDDAAFSACFAGAGLVVFPSDFEGFGLPAAEALRLGIPLVVSPDPALAEITGGHAAIARSVDADDLCAAMEDALSRTPEQRAAARAYAEEFTWARTATTVRDSLVGLGVPGD